MGWTPTHTGRCGNAGSGPLRRASPCHRRHCHLPGHFVFVGPDAEKQTSSLSTHTPTQAGPVPFISAPPAAAAPPASAAGRPRPSERPQRAHPAAVGRGQRAGATAPPPAAKLAPPPEPGGRGGGKASHTAVRPFPIGGSERPSPRRPNQVAGVQRRHSAMPPLL